MRKSQQGMTLIELLVAMTIFAIMSVMVYTALNNVLRNKAGVEAQADRLGALQQTFNFLERDFEQLVNRPARDEYGDKKDALWVPGLGGAVVELTHAGYGNPAGLPRSQLQRVAYRFAEKKLIRQFWPTVDRAPNVEPIERVLIAHVESFTLRYLQGSEWRDTWPPLGSTHADELPIAVEATLELPGFGKVRRLFRVPIGVAGLN